MYWYPRNCAFKHKRVEVELEALKKAAKAKGMGESAIDSFWLRGPQAIADYDRVNGMLLHVHEEAGFETKQHSIE